MAQPIYRRLQRWNDTMRAIRVAEYEPLVITCELASPLVSPERFIAIDSMLAYQAVLRTDQPRASNASDCVPVEIPIARSECRRFHLASIAQFNIDKHGVGYTNKRFPTQEAANLSKMRRVETSNGLTKAFRIPREHLHVDRLTWYCIGKRDVITDLLSTVTSIGKKRGVGMGETIIGSWIVEQIVPWVGFPVLRDGAPLRPLPCEFPGIDKQKAEPAFRCLSYPYWDRTREVECVTQPSDW